jgi:hypothetical protein
MKRFWPLLCLSALFLSACSSGPNYRPVPLPSGKIIRVLAMTRMHFSSGPDALMLRYQTDLKVSDTVALRKEIDEIWASFQTDVEKGNFREAIISANEIPSGTIFKQYQSYNFVFKKNDDGSWRCTNDKS